MAEFCRQCSEKFYGKDYKELAGLCRQDQEIEVICDGCGPILIDCHGNRVINLLPEKKT